MNRFAIAWRILTAEKLIGVLIFREAPQEGDEVKVGGMIAEFRYQPCPLKVCDGSGYSKNPDPEGEDLKCPHTYE